MRSEDAFGPRCLDVHVPLFLFFQVVMAVAQLYWHISPKSEAGIISKSLVRLLRSNR